MKGGATDVGQDRGKEICLMKKVSCDFICFVSGMVRLFDIERWYKRKARKAVRRYCHPKDQASILETIHAIQMDIPSSSICKGKYLEGVIRMVYLEELDESQFETINDILTVIKDNRGLQELYDGNFNGLFFEDLCFKFDYEINRLLEEERNASGNMVYHPNNVYSIRRVHSFEEAMEYSHLTSWCISESRFDYEGYTRHGETFYVCLKDGYMDVPMEEGQGHPLDAYGLSMIAISVRKNGRLASCTTRWNEASRNGRILTTQQISQLIGQDFYSVFVPG